MYILAFLGFIKVSLVLASYIAVFVGGILLEKKNASKINAGLALGQAVAKTVVSDSKTVITEVKKL